MTYICILNYFHTVIHPRPLHHLLFFLYKFSSVHQFIKYQLVIDRWSSIILLLPSRWSKSLISRVAHSRRGLNYSIIITKNCGRKYLSISLPQASYQLQMRFQHFSAYLVMVEDFQHYLQWRFYQSLPQSDEFQEPFWRLLSASVPSTSSSE